MDWCCLESALKKEPQSRNAEEIEAMVQKLKPVFCNDSTDEGYLRSFARAVYWECHEGKTVLCLQDECIDRFCYIWRGSVTMSVDCTSFANTAPGVSGTGLSTGTLAGVGNKTQPKQGAKKRVKNYGTEVDTLKPGHYFGEYCCMSSSESKSPLSIVTNEYTELLVLSKESFQQILKGHFVSLLLKTATFLCTYYPFIHSWSLPELSLLCCVLREKHYSLNEPIVMQGSTINHVYFIKSGLVKLSLDERKVVLSQVKSKIRPPSGLLAQILRRDTSASGSATAGTAANNSAIKKKVEKPKQMHVAMKRSGRKKPEDLRAETEQALRRYRPREYNPLVDTPLCVLAPGGVVGGIEVLCELKQQLFTAMAETSCVSLYQINLTHFNNLFNSTQSSHQEQILIRLLEHIKHWSGRLPRVELFEYLIMLFEQKLQELERSRLMMEGGDELHFHHSHHHRKSRPELLPRQIKDYICA